MNNANRQRLHAMLLPFVSRFFRLVALLVLALTASAACAQSAVRTSDDYAAPTYNVYMGRDGGQAAAESAVRGGLRLPSDRLALQAVPTSDGQQIAAQGEAAIDAPSGGWSVNAMRLLPALIAIGVVLAVTLRAFVLLQREMARRVATEARLATQLSFQQTMMEVVPYPLVAKDLRNRYIAVNRAFEKTLGLRREDIIGRTTLEVQSWGADNSRRLHELAGLSLSTEQREEVEIAFRNLDGDLRHGLFWTGAFAAADGKMAGVVGTMIDITDIRDAEMRARDNERRLHDVTRSLPAVVFQLRRFTRMTGVRSARSSNTRRSRSNPFTRNSARPSTTGVAGFARIWSRVANWTVRWYGAAIGSTRVSSEREPTNWRLRATRRKRHHEPRTISWP
jgi:PAS domain S-box-containing protein